MSGAFNIFFMLALVIILCSFLLSLSRLLNCLIVVENFNVLLLFSSVFVNWDGSYVFFIALMVIFTIEVVLALVVLVQIWNTSFLIGTLGW